jgi:methyl-accepting chemotaxis protein
MFHQMTYLKKCLEKLLEGDLDFKIEQKILSANNEFGATARCLQELIDQTRESTEILNKVSKGDFSKVDNDQKSKRKLPKAVTQVATSLKLLNQQADIICNNINTGLPDTSGVAEKLTGTYGHLNEAMELAMDKIYGLESVFDELPWMVTMMDNNKVWLFANVTTINAYGCKKEDMIGTECLDPDVEKTHERLRAGEKQLYLEASSGYIIIANMAFIKNRKGETVGIANLAEDVTQRVKTQRSVQSEVKKVQDNLANLANGNFNFDIPSSNDSENQVEELRIFNDINVSFFKASETILSLTKEIGNLTNEFVNGNTGYRSNETTFSGAYGDIINGINVMLDAAIEPSRVTSEYLLKISHGEMPPLIESEYKGDFDTMIKSLNRCITAINSMMSDVSMIVKSVDNGILSTRADISKHHGEFKNIISGVNRTLDLVTSPVKETSLVLQAVADGDLSQKVIGDYKGENAAIKDAMNNTVDSLKSYISEISSVLSSMANGNLDCTLKANYQGDFVEIKNSLTNIIRSFNELIGRVKEASSQVASGSKQVSVGSQNLSQGATEQASSIEELTSSIAEISSQTKQNAMDASQANSIVSSAQVQAESGNQKMEQMLSSIREISESSSSISKIIKVIDDIAFQTNILALNAAVEAARAGQYGKGFAVVAEEVRNLAAKSAEAAKNTTGLIEGSISKVETGTKIANETAQTLTQIAESVQKTATLVSNISKASNEQATAISQIDQGLTQVSNVVQTNSATAEESAASSEELSSQAELLSQVVDKFNLKN